MSITFTLFYMNVNRLTLTHPCYPAPLRHIATAPAQLFVMGDSLEELMARPRVTVVGSRKLTAYGKAVTAQLAGELARAGVVVISGLAIGVDAVAHRAALEAGGLTLAVLPSSVEEIYPRSHHTLAQQIIAQGGILLSEYPKGSPTYPGNFVARNRIASGLADAVLITEAAEKSGTLHTARFALEQGKEVLAVPGNITSPTAAGTNNLIKSGATPVTCAEDIFHVLGIAPTSAHRTKRPQGSTPEEQVLLDLLHAGTSNGSELLAQSKLDIRIFNQTLTMLEIRGHIRPLGGNNWALS